MQRIFVALVISYFLVITAAFVLGVWAHDERSFAVHFIFGLLATLLTCLVYCAVLTYFVVTGKMVKLAVLKSNLDAQLIQRSQQPKSRIVRLGVLAVGAALAAALLGAWASLGGAGDEQRRTVHWIAEVLAVAINGAVFLLVYQFIHHHARLVDGVFQQSGKGGSEDLAQPHPPATDTGSG